MPNILAAVGEHRDDPDHLLLGEDGLYYDLHLTDGATRPTPATSGSSSRPPTPETWT